MKNYKEFLNENKHESFIYKGYECKIPYIEDKKMYSAGVYKDNKYVGAIRGWSTKDKCIDFCKNMVENHLKEGNIFMSGSSYTSNTDRIAAYNDLSPEDRKLLDDYCEMQYANTFQNCSYDEQSTARSVVWANKEGDKGQDEIDKENEREAKM